MIKSYNIGAIVILILGGFVANHSSASAQNLKPSRITLEGMDYRRGSKVFRKQTYDTVYLTFGTTSGQRVDKLEEGVDLEKNFLISGNSFPGAAYNCIMFGGSAVVYSSTGTFSKSYSCPHDKRPSEISYVNTDSSFKRVGNMWYFDGNATIKGKWLSSNYEYVIKEKIQIMVDPQKSTCRLIDYRRVDDHIEHAEDAGSSKGTTVTKSVKTVCTIE